MTLPSKKKKKKEKGHRGAGPLGDQPLHALEDARIHATAAEQWHTTQQDAQMPDGV